MYLRANQLSLQVNVKRNSDIAKLPKLLCFLLCLLGCHLVFVFLLDVRNHQVVLLHPHALDVVLSLKSFILSCHLLQFELHALHFLKLRLHLRLQSAHFRQVLLLLCT